MSYRSALVVLPLALALTACGSADSEASSSPSSAAPEPSFSSATPTAAEALSGKATCDRLVGNGDDALGLRVADYTVEIMNADEIDEGAYRSAKDLADELDELAEIADPLYADAIEGLKAGPQAVVDVVEKAKSNLDIPAQEMMQAGLDAGEECLSGGVLDKYASELSNRINQLPAEYGGKTQQECLETMYVGIVNEGWNLVVASIGARDHQERVVSFYDTVADLSDDSAPGCAGDVELASLAFEASVMQTMVVATGEADPSEYTSARKTIEAWFSAIGRDDLDVVSP